ncbi:MAG: hypothetical protein OHK93_008500 [Ramalina farinacea]|uniref:Uncharacterized protein n=1 Tax=Ramalina farinacea TaxID=258253 RepID=A0AA43QMJ2_9LECA|nr:hypothetical protein [Ramalina farinacea]
MLSSTPLTTLLLFLTPALLTLTNAIPSGYSNTASSSSSSSTSSKPPPPECYTQSARQRAPLTSCLTALSLFPNTTLTTITPDGSATIQGNDSAIFTSALDRYPHNDGLPRVELPVSRVSDRCNVTISLTQPDKGVLVSWEAVKNETRAEIDTCKLVYTQGVYSTGGVFNVTGGAANKADARLRVQVQLFEPPTREGTEPS